MNRIVHDDGTFGVRFGKCDAGLGDALQVEGCGVRGWVDGCERRGGPLTTSVTVPWPIAFGGSGRDDAGGGEDVDGADVEAFVWRGFCYGVGTGLLCGARLARKAMEMARSSKWGDCWVAFALLAGIKGYLTLASSETAGVLVLR